MRIFMIIFYTILILFGISFAALNAQSVPINFYFTTVQIPISVLMILMLGLGVSVGLILMMFRYWCLRAEHRKIKNQLQLTEREIKNLRIIPLK